MDPAVLTTTLKAFVSVFSLGFGRLTPDAYELLRLLATLELAILAFAWVLSRDTNIVAEIVWYFLRLGLFIFLVFGFPGLCQIVMESFMLAGLKAGGSTVTVAELSNPSAIAQLGFVATEPIFLHVKHYGFVSGIKNFGDILITGLSGLLILLSFFIIAAQLFLTLLEFYLLAVLATILIPWGVFRPTAFIAERAFGMVIAQGVKVMVLAFITSAAFPVLQGLRVPPNPDWNQVFAMLSVSGTLALLSWHAPSVASAMVSGGPALTTGVALQSAVGAALGASGFGKAVGAANAQAVKDIKTAAQIPGYLRGNRSIGSGGGVGRGKPSGAGKTSAR